MMGSAARSSLGEVFSGQPPSAPSKGHHVGMPSGAKPDSLPTASRDSDFYVKSGFLDVGD